MNIWHKWSKLIKIQECIWLGAFILYFLGIITGGLFTAYYGTMLFLIIGALTAVIAIIKKHYLLGLANLIIPVLGLILYIEIG